MDDHRKTSSRRAFLQKMSFAAAAACSLFASGRSEAAEEAGAAATNVASRKEAALSCSDVSKLTKEQIETRKALQYVDDSPHEEKRCNNCQLFEQPGEGEECGGCQVVPGPIHPNGYCTAWMAPVVDRRN
jgi:hypothetical protein